MDAGKGTHDESPIATPSGWNPSFQLKRRRGYSPIKKEERYREIMKRIPGAGERNR